MEQKYRIQINYGDFKIEIESHDKDWVEQKEKRYLEKIIENPKQIKSPPETKSTPLPQNLSINEFYQKFIKVNKISSRPNIAVFLIYYLQNILKKQEIKTQDVVQAFADIAYPNYNKLNMTDILNQAKRKALLNYVNNNWSLTITGEDYVINLITGNND